MAKKAKAKRGRPKTMDQWRQLNIRARPEDEEAIDTIKRHRGIAGDSDAIRFALAQEANRCRAEAAKLNP